MFGRVLLRLLPLGFALALTSGAYACSCTGPIPTCAVFHESPVIFRGRVVEITLQPAPLEFVKNSDGTPHAVHRPGRFRVRFQVAETFRGQTRREMTIYTAEQSSMCGSPFQSGVEYVVFTYNDGKTGDLSTGRCSSTHPYVEGAEDKDVAWMRACPKAPGGVTISGVFRGPAGVELPSPLRVSLRGPASVEVIADGAGAFSAGGLPAGEYMVSAEVPRGFSTEAPRKVAAADKSCAQTSWRVAFDGHIRGLVTDASGAPIAKMGIEAQFRNPRTNRVETAYAATDEQGRYDLARLSPGEYRVFANRHGPTPSQPYPGGPAPDKGSPGADGPIQLEASASVDRVNFTFPMALHAVVVHATVLLPDGSAAAGARVYARMVGNLSAMEVPSAETDASGHADLTVYEGKEYTLSAIVYGNSGQRCGGWRSFTGGQGMMVDPLTIDREGGGCR